jgi:hypothetical protein
MFKILTTYIYLKKYIYKIEHLEGSGTPSYIWDARFLKVNASSICRSVMSICYFNCYHNLGRTPAITHSADGLTPYQIVFVTDVQKGNRVFCVRTKMSGLVKYHLVPAVL